MSTPIAYLLYYRHGIRLSLRYLVLFLVRTDLSLSRPFTSQAFHPLLPLLAVPGCFEKYLYTSCDVALHCSSTPKANLTINASQS